MHWLGVLLDALGRQHPRHHPHPGVFLPRCILGGALPADRRLRLQRPEELLGEVRYLSRGLRHLGHHRARLSVWVGGLAGPDHGRASPTASTLGTSLAAHGEIPDALAVGGRLDELLADLDVDLRHNLAVALHLRSPRDRVDHSRPGCRGGVQRHRPGQLPGPLQGHAYPHAGSDPGLPRRHLPADPLGQALLVLLLHRVHPHRLHRSDELGHSADGGVGLGSGLQGQGASAQVGELEEGRADREAQRGLQAVGQGRLRDAGEVRNALGAGGGTGLAPGAVPCQ
mmetsp:Transcript_32375/g.73797  ORF Transcript_32375/g.73797 Transcript_32375/m.73797 type:complete len:284 (-) Transcript_32375:337-1188(-)